jgi:hypothetical protein
LSNRGPNSTNNRLERRAEREARQPGASVPRARRQRAAPIPVKAKTGRFSSLPWAMIVGIGGAFVIIAFVAYAAIQASKGQDSGPTSWQKAMQNDDPKIPGTYIPPHPGADGKLCTDATCVQGMDDRLHIAPIIPICDQKALDAKNYSNPLCYNSNPPTSGPHGQNPAPFRVLTSPAPKEALVHNMEHGGVVVWYNTTNQKMIKQLTDVVSAELGRQRLVVMSPYTEMEPETIALTSWTRLDKFAVKDFADERVQRFIARNSRRFNPEGF